MIRIIIFLICCCNIVYLFADNDNASQINQIFNSNNDTPIPSIMDNYESYNRSMFAINMQLDCSVVRPVAVWYDNYMPNPLRYTANNFFNNLRDFVSLTDDMLQFRGLLSMQTFMRIAINSTLGIFGAIDISSSLGLTVPKNSFGNTLKFYGWTNSSYFIIPLLGPSTIRDTIGLIPDIYFNPIWHLLHNNYITVLLFAMDTVDIRASYLKTDDLLELSFDQYLTIKDLYTQSIENRNNNY